MDPVPQLLTLRQAAAMLGCSPNTLRNWDAAGRLKAVRIGPRRDRRYRLADIRRLIDGLPESVNT